MKTIPINPMLLQQEDDQEQEQGQEQEQKQEQEQEQDHEQGQEQKQEQKQERERQQERESMVTQIVAKLIIANHFACRNCNMHPQNQNTASLLRSRTLAAIRWIYENNTHQPTATTSTKSWIRDAPF